MTEPSSPPIPGAPANSTSTQSTPAETPVVRAAAKHPRSPLSRYLPVAALAVAALLGLIWAINPFSVRSEITGLLCWDAFYRYRPTRYWAEELNANRKRREAAWQSLHAGGLEARPVLEAIARNNQAPLTARQKAIELLGELKHPDLAAPLTDLLLHDGDAAIRAQAAKELGKMEGAARAAIPQLVETLKEPESERTAGLRELCADVLARLGGEHSTDGVFWQNRPASGAVCDWKSLAFSADGRMLLAYRDNEIHTWSLTATPWYVSSCPPATRRALVHPGGHWAVLEDDQGQVKLWDVRRETTAALENIRRAGTGPEKQPSYQLAASADGRYLAVVGPRLLVYDLTRSPRQLLRHWEFMTGTPTLLDQVARRLATVSDSYWLALARMPACYQAVFSPDGRTLAVAVTGPLTWESKTTESAWLLLDVASGKRLGQLPRQSQTAVFSPDGKQFLTLAEDHRCAQLWDVSAEHLQSTPKPARLIDAPAGEVWNAFAFHSDNRTIALACSNHHLYLYDGQAGQMRPELKWHLHPITAVAFSPDGRKLVSADNHGWVKRWDLTRLLDACPPSEGQAIVPWN